MTINRRRFLQTTTSTSTALLLSSLNSFAFPLPDIDTDSNFKLKFLATNWGFAGTLDEYCAKAKKKDMMALKYGGRAIKLNRTNYLHY